ncbi:MAG: ABC transporter substrate-binding protein [Chloroflexota bacterium]|nr:ABC transporter substrate-binding protein [Chloroflexota bacterium]MDE2941175.1 ABC transporter substrate-binding protein [Chloroflexota bacterium]MDE3267054.1 ABC transporter substrate-binding protein [Chloroflexota bacterium]
MEYRTRSAALASGWRTAWKALAILACAAVVACNGAEVTPTSSGAATPTPPVVVSATETPGVTDDAVLFGQSAAFSGPAQELGRGMRLGIRAAFQEVNESGGVNGRRIDLVSLDDTYEPELAIQRTLHLIEAEEVFALIGAVGTPTSRSATPIAKSAGVPYIAPFTGAEFLRGADLDNVINLRASYYQETEEMVARLTSELGFTRIAVLHQDDSYGRAGYQGALLALERRGMEPVSIGVYPRNTTAVKTAVLDLQRGNPQAVIMIGAYEPVARAVSWALRIGMESVFMNVSFVGSNALAEELGDDGAGVFVTQVVPYPTDDSLPVVASYLEALAAYDSEAVPGFVSLEGYLAGRLAISGLELCGTEVSRECFLDAIRNAGDIDIDGFSLLYGSGDNQGSDTVFLTVIGQDGGVHAAASLGDPVP